MISESPENNKDRIILLQVNSEKSQLKLNYFLIAKIHNITSTTFKFKLYFKVLNISVYVFNERDRLPGQFTLTKIRNRRYYLCGDVRVFSMKLEARTNNCKNEEK